MKSKKTIVTPREMVVAAAWTDGPAGIIAVAATGFLVDAGDIDAESLVYYGPLAALVARYVVDTARLLGRILRARVAGLEGPTVRALALLVVLSPLLGACAGAEGTVAAGVDVARALEDRKTRTLLLAHETASIARCSSNLSSIFRVAPLEQAEAIVAWCRALALRERETMEDALSRQP